MRKRIFSLIISASMFFSLLPVNAELIDPDDLAADGKVIENVALNKTAYRKSDSSSLSGWTNGVELDDGQQSATNWLMYSDGDYGIIDLGKAYNIAAVGIMSTTMAWNYAPTSIYGTNNSSCLIDNAELIADISMTDVNNAEAIGSGDVKKPIVPANSGKYRYILFKPTDPSCDGIIAKEVYVYAKLTDEYGEWNITESGNVRTFEIPVTYVNPSQTKNYKMIIASYDNNGNMSGYTEEDASGTTLTGSINLTAECSKSQAVLLCDGVPVSGVPVASYGFDGFSANNGTAASFESAVSQSNGDDYSQITGKTVSSSDVITASVVKSDATTAEEAFGSVSGYHWYGAVISNNGYSFKIPFSVGGQYYIRVTRYTKSGTSENKYYRYNMIDATARQGCIDSFVNFVSNGENNLSAYIAEAVDELGIISADSLINRSAAEENAFAEIFTEIRDIMGYTNVTAAELIENINTATVVYFLKNGDNSYMTEHGSLVTDNAAVKEYAETELGYSFTADVAANFDISVPVTNLGTDGRLSFSFIEEMNPATLTTENIKIYKNGNAVDYEILLADSNKLIIDKAELETGGEYKISFNAGCLTKEGKKIKEVKNFEFTAGEILDIPYKEGKIIKCVTLNKPVTAERDAGWQEVQNSIIVDGNKSSYVLFKENAVIKIDLGDYYDICGVNFVGDDASTARWYHNTGVSVIGSAVSDEFSEDYSLMLKYSETQSEVASQMDCLQSVANVGKVRYLGLKKSDSTGILMREISAYAYVDTEFGEWETSAFNGAGDYTFTIPAIENIENKTYYMLISAYDADGNVVEKVLSPVNTGGTSLSGTITAPAGTVGITAVIVADINGLKALTDSVTIGTPIVTQTASENGFSVTADDNGLYVNAGLSDSIKKSSRVIVTAVKTEESGKTAQTAYSEMTNTEFSNNLVYTYTSKCSSGVKFTIDKLGLGKYYINASVSGVDGSVQNIYYKYTVVSDTEKQNMISAFMSGNTQILGTVINDAVNTSEIISKDLLADVSVINDETYLKLVEYTRDLLYTDTQKAQADKVDDVVKVINAAALIKAFYDGNSEKAQIIAKDYSSLLGEYYEASVDAAKFTAVFSEIKNNINSSETLGNVLNWSKMLSYMKNTTTADIAIAMRKYETELGIDLTYASNNNVSVERAVEFMSFANMNNLFGKTAFNNAYKTAVDSAKSSNSTESNPVSGGSGAVGAWGKTASSVPSVQPTDTKALAFSDLSGYMWANDAVTALRDKGIVNGTEYGTFEPSRNVTRAEFVKMLVMAADIRIDESVYMSFIDVPDGSWYYPYIKIAFSKRICNGVSDYYFNPDGYITRQDMAVLTANFMKVTGLGASGEKTVFNDFEAVSEYAQDAVTLASEAGIINGFDDGSFKPLDNTRRVDAAMVIYKLTGLIE